MKIRLLLLLVTFFLFNQCSQDKSISPKIDKNKASIELMNELRPQLTGTWVVKQLQIKPQNSTFHGELGIRKDTTLTNFARLDIAPNPIQFSPTSTRYIGHLQYGSKNYPIRFELLAGPWIFSQKGSKAYFLLDYNFPIGPSRPTEREEYFLQQIGLMLETFSLNIATDQLMIWEGLNRGIERIELIKN